MSGWWQRIVALSDSQLTADFQRTCGIRSLRTYEQNGSESLSNGVCSPNVNGFADEECHDLQKLHVDAHHAIRNGSVPVENGSADVHDVSLKKRASGTKHTNGYINHSSTNGGPTVLQRPPYQNGTPCHCQHENHRPVTNGCIANGETPKAHSDGAPKNSKQKSYVIQNTVLFYIFSFGASLGNEVFYIVFFSFGMWNFDTIVFRKISLIWCAIMYLGQAAKDLICWPRPLSPPVVRLEGRYELEYGMPSTHAMVGVVIPFGLLYYSYGVYEYNLFLGIVVASVWCVLVSFSRLYLGMHSVLDILVGIVTAGIIMVCCIPFVDMVDTLLIAHPWCFPGLNVVGIGLCLAYPELKQWSTARGDTTQVMAVFSGMYQGLWYMGQTSTMEDATASALAAHTGWALVVAAVVRQLVGMVIVTIILECLKKAVIYVTASLIGLDPRDPTSKQHLTVELSYKYIGYFTPSFFAAYVLPCCFQALGIHRGNYIKEILTHGHYFGL
ncbi:hypothetical protein BaRGS_00003309 [Batillaria attramentaria]|uniref:Phosphatidic acid phosphatase type 2/haloperoxidase domain-containing protein n=1 Tax=Batillaria attramentaria TaxID=370345 RepID=A0ABD0M0W7_9CAEN